MVDTREKLQPNTTEDSRSGRPKGLESVESRDLALGLLSLDYDAQVIAIRSLLLQHRHADAELINEIERIEGKYSRKGSQWAADQRVDLLHGSIYQGAAHSMAAVGMLVPFIESMFCSVFGQLREHFFQGKCLPNQHPRWKFAADEEWDCHFFYDRGRHPNVAKGIMQLADAVGLLQHLPDDLNPTLQALFEYRNKMFHHGFEWPVLEREKFARRIAEASQKDGWSADWFSRATSDGKPWIFYLTDNFIEHSLVRIDRTIDGVGAFVEEQFARRT